MVALTVEAALDAEAHEAERPISQREGLRDDPAKHDLITRVPSHREQRQRRDVTGAPVVADARTERELGNDGPHRDQLGGQHPIVAAQIAGEIRSESAAERGVDHPVFAESLKHGRAQLQRMELLVLVADRNRFQLAQLRVGSRARSPRQSEADEGEERPGDDRLQP